MPKIERRSDNKGAAPFQRGSIPRWCRRSVALTSLLVAALVAGCTGGSGGNLTPYTQDIVDTALTFDMVAVPGGTVEVATKAGLQTIEVKPFYMASVEATWELYDAYHMRLDRKLGAEGAAADAVTRPSMPYLPPDRGYGHAGYAAISISYKGADTFCNWLSLKTGKKYRLPTEAEWQYACELGDVEALGIDEVAWHVGNSDFQPQPVGSKAPNGLGLFDMKGNIAEWCTGLDGVPLTMGGSFLDNAETLSCTLRVPESPAWNDSDPQEPKGTWWLADADFVGFRIVCEPE